LDSAVELIRSSLNTNQRFEGKRHYPSEYFAPPRGGPRAVLSATRRSLSRVVTNTETGSFNPGGTFSIGVRPVTAR
jgi:hypothetical protein